MPDTITPRQWAERAFDGIEADESLFASVERVIGEAMAAAKGGAAKPESVYTFGAGVPIPDGYVFAGISDDGRPFYELRSDRIEQLEAAMRSIVERCANTGRGDATVNDRIIERVEEIAVEAMAKP